MDGRQFDALARALASGRSRREVVRGFLSGVVGGMLSLVRYATTAAQEDSPAIEPRGGSSDTEPEEELSRRSNELDYFAIGDSIASGHGLDDQGEPCRQSRKAYPFAAARELRRRYQTVHFEDPDNPPDYLDRRYFWACSGANTDLYEILPALVSDVLANLSDRPALVSITIGANDFGWTDPFNLLRRLYYDSEPAFRRWVDDIVWGAGGNAKAPKPGGTWEQLRTQVKRLVARDSVYVVLTEVYNPFNPSSVFFLLSDPALCKWGEDAKGGCYARAEYGLDQLNAALGSIARDEELNPPGRPKRVALTEEVRKRFKDHAAPRTTCGDGPPDVGEPSQDGKPREEGTWVQYRNDPRSNSFPFEGQLIPAWVPDWLLGRLGDKTHWRGDCIHPNEDGAKAIATAVVAAALPLLEPMMAAKPRITSGPDVAEVGPTSAVVTWTSDQPTNGVVEYGQTTDYGRERPRDVGEETTEHRVVLDNLEPGRRYHFRVRSTNANGEVVSQDQTFATESLCAPVGDPCSTDSDCCPDGLPYEPTCWDNHCVRICQIDDECAVDDPCVDFYCSPRGRCLYNNREECRAGSSNCPWLQIECGGTCVDPNTDSRYCGGCEGHDCGEKPCRDGVCADSSDGLCQPSDGLDNYRVCGPAGAENACVCLGTSEGQGWCGRVGSYTYRCDEKLPACASSADCLPGWACVSAVGCDRACWPACDAASGGGGSIAGDSSLEMHWVLCPSNYQEGDYYGACHYVGQAGVAFALDGPKGSSATGTTRILVDAGPGVVRFDGLVAGQYILREIEGSLSDGVYVFCSPDQGQTVVIDWSGVPTEPVVVPIPEATAMVCDWYTVPGGWAGS